MEREPLLEAAVQAAQEAGRYLRDAQGRVAVEDKGHPTDLVTAADRGAEALIRAHLAEQLPEIPFLGEESGGQMPEAGACWVVDPLDGTTNWVSGLPLWCVSIALVSDGRPVVGVVHAPALNETFTVTAGGGAYLGDEPIRVAEAADLESTLVVARPSLDRRTGEATNVAVSAAVVRQALGVRGLGVSALELAWVAAGRFGGFYHHRLQPWDVAAGLLLIEEAGGLVTRPDGQAFDLAPGAILATNRRIHPALLALLQE